MRELAIGTKRFTIIVAVDDPSHGHACHEYIIERVDANKDDDKRFCIINFQKGPIKEHGVNGIHNEDLLCIVIDRLQGFQSGPFKCKENAMALTKIEEALMWLNKRTKKRQEQNEEGTSEKHKS